MIRTITAGELQTGDILSTSGAKISEATPSHHGEKVYLRAKFEDGYTQVVTVPVGNIVHVWTPDEAIKGA